MKIVVINGYPESGKDEFILAASKKFLCINYSTINTCKYMAVKAGWNGIKDDDSRLMLSELKRWYVKHFDGVMRDLTATITQEKEAYTPIDYFFVVSREGNEIERIREWCSINGYDCSYVFLERSQERDFGNDSDNGVKNDAVPDVVFKNTGESLDELHDKVVDLLNNLSG